MTGYDPDLSQIIRLAERVVCAVTLLMPDWCAIARDAGELTSRLQARYDQRGENKLVA